MKKTFILLLASVFVAASSVKAQIPTLIVGDYKVSLLNEVQGKGYADILIDDTPQILEECLVDDGYPNAINAFLIQTPDHKNILVDTGLGSRLIENLNMCGLAPEDINIILLTHMHGDHIGALLKDGVAAFPRALLIVSEVEYDSWSKIDIRHDKSSEKRAGAYAAFEVFKAYKGQIQTFKPSVIGEDAAFVTDSIAGLAAYGHTPGHVMYMVESKGEKLLIWGDLTHALSVQIPYPQVAVTYDSDPVKAVESRKKVLEYVAANNIVVTGMHVPNPFFGTITDNAKGGYVFSTLDKKKYPVLLNAFTPKLKEESESEDKIEK